MPYMKPKKATEREEAEARETRARRRRALKQYRAERTAVIAERDARVKREEEEDARERKKNASPARLKQIDAEMKAHLLKIDQEVLFADGAYGRKPTVKDWEGGKDFHAYHPTGDWVGGPYFSIRDAEKIYALGYRKIVFGGAEGFDVDLVMQ